MKTIKNTNFDPYYNLALEEYLLKSSDINEDLFFLWRNKKSVVLGRNQNPYNEINIEYAKKNDIDIVRRSTGGGTVYHDKGNINFTFITSKVSERLHNYKYFLLPIISILNNLGIQAKFYPKTHIYIGNNKVSGNAQMLYKTKMIHHGTLLFDVNTDHLINVLNNKNKIDTHAIISEHSEVLNIGNILSVAISIEEFMDYIIEQVGLNENDIIKLSDRDYDEVAFLANSKYHSWDWNFGQTPKFSIKKNDYEFIIKNYIIVHSSHFGKTLLGLKFDKNIIYKELSTHKDRDKIMELLFT